MQIVIDISEERFRDIQRIAEVQRESNHFKTAEQIVAKGIPLPKGHGRLIDAEGCTMPHSDKWYACPIDSAKPENQKALEEMAAEWAEEQYYTHLEEVAGRKEN